ncbi:unnamed protein product [Ambrosiozyma monospora]|uniref:Unnamed protein product n=1 Tax=Ambrosiozyma monospora TaxID=43982 RepID=A0A9W6Z6Q6_AMBMO|nr:unnamed protein product [Ambrosiozyma monospora]
MAPVYFGPYLLVKKLNDNAFEVDLPITEKKHRTINVKYFRRYFDRGVKYSKVPPRTLLETKARVKEIISFVGYDVSNKEVAVTWQGCDPKHCTKVPYDVIELLPPTRVDELIRQCSYLPLPLNSQTAATPT